MKITKPETEESGDENPYLAPSSGPPDTITEKQYENRDLLRGCLLALVIAGPSGPIATLVLETMTSKRGMDPHKLIPIVVAYLCASFGSTIWAGNASFKDFRRIESEKKLRQEFTEETSIDEF